jgi:DNA-directed RNA polymerase subunit RPC12/RpoP
LEAKCSECKEFYDELDEEPWMIEADVPMICYECKNKYLIKENART